MTYQSAEIARYRIQEARDRAGLRRLIKTANVEAPTPNTRVFDAVGHGLIAIGTRLVSDPTEHPTHRRAA